MVIYEVRNRRGEVVGCVDSLTAAQVVARHHRAITDQHHDVFEVRQVWSTETVPDAMARRFEPAPVTARAILAARDIADRYRNPTDALTYGAAVQQLRGLGFTDQQADDILHPVISRKLNGCGYPVDI